MTKTARYDDHGIDAAPQYTFAGTVDPDLIDAERLRVREIAEGDWTVVSAAPDASAAPVATAPVRSDAADAVSSRLTDDLGAFLDFAPVDTGDDDGAASDGLTPDERAQLEYQSAIRGVDASGQTDEQLVDFVSDAQVTGIEHGFVPTASALDAAARAQLVGGDFALETEGGKVDSGNITIFDAAGRPVTVIEAGEDADPDAVEQAVLDQNAQTQTSEVDSYVAQGYTVVGHGEDGSVLLQSPDGGQVRVHENGNVTVDRAEPADAAPSADGGAAPADDGNGTGQAPADGSGQGDGSGNGGGSSDNDDDDNDDDDPEPDVAADAAAQQPPAPAEGDETAPDTAAASTPNPEDITSDPDAAAEFYDSPLFGHGTGGPGIRVGGIPDDPEGVEENPAARKAFEDSPLGGGPDKGLDGTRGTGPAREDFEFGSGRHVIDPRDIDNVELAANGGGAAGPTAGDDVPGNPLAGADNPLIGPPPIVGGGGTHADAGADVVGVGAIDSPVRDVDVSFDDVELDLSHLDAALV